MSKPSAWAVQKALKMFREALVAEDSPLVMDEEAMDAEASELNVLSLLDRVLEEEADVAGMARVAKERQAQLAARAARYEAQQEQLRALALNMMTELGRKKYRTGPCTVSITDGRPGFVIDEEALPNEYRVEVVRRSPNKAKVREALAAGLTVPGVLPTNACPIITIRRT